MGVTVRWVLAVVAAWAAALGVNRSLRRVRGPSMLPTLAPGDLVLALPVRRPRRGEVVLVRDPRHPDDPTSVHVKRVVGLPGEQVALTDGVLRLDGRVHAEPYRRGRGPDATLHVPAEHVAVLGDAREASTDSRAYGPVPLDLVLRRVPLRCWPRPALLAAAPAPTHAPAASGGR